MKTSTSLFRTQFYSILLLGALVAGARLAAEESAKTLQVFLFAGQSNMVGADAHPDRIDDYPMFKGAGAPQSDVLYATLADPASDTFGGWGPLQPRDSFGSELTFALRMKAAGAGPIAIIKSAIGGTTVAFDWNPDAPDQGQKLYPRTLNLVRAALQELDRRHLPYHLAGVMWHQGENDMLDRRLNTNYAAGLTQLIARMRQDLHSPELPWYIAEVSEKGIWGMDNRHNLAILRQQQDQVLQADARLHWVPTSHLAFEVMGSGQPHYHFGTQGQLQLGEAFATAYLAGSGKAPGVPSRKFLAGPPITAGKRVQLLVLAGQRNMEGEDSFVSEIPSATGAGFKTLVAPQENILFRYSLGGGFKKSRSWEPLGPMDFLGNFGPELSFGARLRRAFPAQEGLAIVKFTHSGAQGPDWLPSGSPEARRNLYPQFLDFIREARADLIRQGCEVRLAGVFWHTGENDTYFGPYQKKYAGWMKELITQVRLDLQQPDLPWFISEQHPGAIWGNLAAMNASLNAMAQKEQHVYVIPTGQLPHGRLHFGTQGTLQLGEAMAEAYLKMPN